MVEDGKLKTLKKMWEKIREEMINRSYTYSIQQLENKWKSLERSYKTMVENKKKTGRGRKSCPYERELREILEKRHSINPVCVLDSISVIEPSSKSITDENESLSSNNNRPVSSTSKSTKRYHRSSQALSSTTHELQQLRLLIADANRIRDEQEQKNIQLRQEMLEEIRIKNKLLQQLLDKM